MSFDINRWKKFLVTESREPELLEEALEDRVPVSVAEDIREDVRGRLRAACERNPRVQVRPLRKRAGVSSFWGMDSKREQETR